MKPLLNSPLMLNMQIKHHKNGAEVAFHVRWNLVMQMQKSNFKYIIIIRLIMCFSQHLNKQLNPLGLRCPKHSCSIGSIFQRSVGHGAYSEGGL